jgi:hypothetical protein
MANIVNSCLSSGEFVVSFTGNLKMYVHVCEMSSGQLLNDSRTCQIMDIYVIIPHSKETCWVSHSWPMLLSDSTLECLVKEYCSDLPEEYQLCNYDQLDITDVKCVRCPARSYEVFDREIKGMLKRKSA